MSYSLSVFDYVLARTKLDLVHLKDTTVSNNQLLQNNGEDFYSLGFYG